MTHTKNYRSNGRSTKVDIGPVNKLRKFVAKSPGWTKINYVRASFGQSISLYTNNKSFYATIELARSSSAQDTPQAALTELIKIIKSSLYKIQGSTGTVWWFKRSAKETTMFHGNTAVGMVEKMSDCRFKFTVRDHNNKITYGYLNTIRAAKSAARSRFKQIMINYAQANM